MPPARQLALSRSRPPAQDLAEAAYGHATAVLGRTVAAQEAAILGVRRGGRSRSTVIGHTRAASLERIGAVEPLDPGAISIPDDLTDLARLLTFTRPPVERAIVDVATRHLLDRAGLGRAIGLPPAVAAARAADALAEWQRLLDPVLLARLGPGACEVLAEILASGGTELLADLLDAGARVASHATECDICRDRLRAMVSVRTLLAGEPFPRAPQAVLEAAALARLRPTAPPPPLERGVPVRRSWRRTALVGLAPLALACAVVAFVVRADEETSPVDHLTRVATADVALRASPATVDAASSPTVVLRNLAGATRWEATPDRPWLLVHPASGDLAAGASVTVVVALQKSAPEGALNGTVTFTADDGSTAAVRVRSRVSRPPDIDAERAGCVVTATVEDESELETVLLHVGVGPSARRIAMRETEQGAWQARFPAGSARQPWRVRATDALGNEASTASATVPEEAC